MDAGPARPTVALLLAALAVLAGCAAPVAERPGTNTTATPEDAASAAAQANQSEAAYDVRVDGELPVNATLVFARTQTLLNSSITTTAVSVDRSPSGSGQPGPVSQFRQLLGIGPPRAQAESDLEVGGVTYTNGQVTIAPNGGEPAEIERTLAHEFVHVAQAGTGVFRNVPSQLPLDRQGTTDARLVTRSVIEGAAVFGSTAYTERYQPSYPTERATLARVYANASAGTQLFWGPYRFGGAHVAARIDDPAALSEVYGDAPVTTEQVIHATDDPVRDLRVTVDPGAWTETRRDSMGELFTRIALDVGLSSDRAASAAAGWGNDQLVGFERGTDQGYAWALRWDDDEEAQAFTAALRTALDERATRTADGWRTTEGEYRIEASGETVVLLTGASEFVAATTVEVADDSVSLSLPESFARAGSAPVPTAG